MKSWRVSRPLSCSAAFVLCTLSCRKTCTGRTTWPRLYSALKNGGGARPHAIADRSTEAQLVEVVREIAPEGAQVARLYESEPTPGQAPIATFQIHTPRQAQPEPVVPVVLDPDSPAAVLEREDVNQTLLDNDPTHTEVTDELGYR